MEVHSDELKLLRAEVERLRAENCALRESLEQRDVLPATESANVSPAAFLESTRRVGVPAYIERSRSGNGAHVRILFAEPMAAGLARRLGFHLVTLTTESRPEPALKSYDRFFPSQDTLPKGGFGNLVALPLQKEPREKGNSVSRLDTMFLALPISWRGTLQQYAGRLHRAHAGKRVVQIYDYVDEQVPVLGRMYRKRLRGYRAMGYAVTDTGAQESQGARTHHA